MGTFRHHPDSTIYLDDGNGLFVYPLAEFLIDEPAYALPAGMIAQDYVQGSYHRVSDGTSQHAEGYPWPTGDGYISKKATYEAAYAARSAPPAPTLAQAQATRNAWLNGQYGQALAQGVAVNATGTSYTYCKSLEEQSDLIGAIAAAQLSGGPVSLRVWKADGSRSMVAHTLAQLQSVLAAGATRKQALAAYLDQQQAAVDAATTVAEAQAVAWVTPA